MSNEFNPDGEVPKKGDGKKPKVAISVEDVTAYLLLAKEKAFLDTPETMARVLLILANYFPRMMIVVAAAAAPTMRNTYAR